jgi:hypothetical protein
LAIFGRGSKANQSGSIKKMKEDGGGIAGEKSPEG